MNTYVQLKGNKNDEYFQNNDITTDVQINFI